MICKKWQRVLPLPKRIILKSEEVALGCNWSILGADDLGELKADWVQEFRLANEDNDKVVELSIVDLNSEAYKIKITENKLAVSAGSKVGLNHAKNTLKQISPDGLIPLGEIEDNPSLKIRGFHVNFDSFRQMDFEEAKQLVKNAAKLKLNTILVEYSNRFPFKKHSKIKAPTAFTHEEVQELIATAQNYGLEVIPLQQSIGHLEYLLQNNSYASIREENRYKDQLCPSNKEAFQVFTELATEIIAMHPRIKYLHIGGDEARRLGTCPICKEVVEKHGVSSLYINYINKISHWLLSKGITPILWDDMVCKNPQAIDDLDRNIVIMYWDYWTVSSKSPYFIARYNRKGKPVTSYDESWDSLWQRELSDLEKSIMDTFATAVPLKESLGEEFLSVYGSYLGDEFPKRVRAYPYLEYYMDKGFKVIGAPTAMGNGDNYHTLPNYWRFIPNIRSFAERCQEAGAEGIITTAWYNYLPLMLHPGLAATAQFAWGLDRGQE